LSYAIILNRAKVSIKKQTGNTGITDGLQNFDRINNEIEYMLDQLLGPKMNGKRDPSKNEVDE
jgi:hypothetical protein